MQYPLYRSEDYFLGTYWPRYKLSEDVGAKKTLVDTCTVPKTSVEIRFREYFPFTFSTPLKRLFAVFYKLGLFWRLSAYLKLRNMPIWQVEETPDDVRWRETRKKELIAAKTPDILTFWALFQNLMLLQLFLTFLTFLTRCFRLFAETLLSHTRQGKGASRLRLWLNEWQAHNAWKGGVELKVGLSFFGVCRGWVKGCKGGFFATKPGSNDSLEDHRHAGLFRFTVARFLGEFKRAVQGPLLSLTEPFLRCNLL